VKLKNDQKRLTFMVVSREQGRFEAKDLPPGSYRVQGVGGISRAGRLRQHDRSRWHAD
jgi:hypothetical protein